MADVGFVPGDKVNMMLNGRSVDLDIISIIDRTGVETGRVPVDEITDWELPAGVGSFSLRGITRDTEAEKLFQQTPEVPGLTVRATLDSINTMQESGHVVLYRNHSGYINFFHRGEVFPTGDCWIVYRTYRAPLIRDDSIGPVVKRALESYETAEDYEASWFDVRE
jgi:hypothetical protein